MKFSSFRHILEVRHDTTFSVDDVHAIQSYHGGNAGNLEVNGKATAQFIFMGDRVSVYCCPDGKIVEYSTPILECCIDDDIPVIVGIITEDFLASLAVYIN